ncbi:MAG: redoxin domain-containing protein [Nitrospirota bacterium]
MHRFVELYKTYDPLEADRIADLLAEHDVPCVVRDLTISPYPMTIGGFGERRISVTDQDVARARSVLEEAIRDGYLSPDGSWMRPAEPATDHMRRRPNAPDLRLLGALLAAALAGCEPSPAAAPLAEAKAPAVREGTRVGFQAPQFALERLDGGVSTLSEFRGKVLLLNFWATWCGPCRAEMPSLEALSHQFPSQDFLVVGISTDYEGAQIVQPFMDSFGLTFPILLDPEMRVNDQFEIRSLPTSMVLDRRGVIRHKFFGAMDWNTPKNRELVRVLVAESGGAPAPPTTPGAGGNPPSGTGSGIRE